jgi:hypothetical protein
MNITQGWWASCVEDGIFIYDETANILEAKYHTTAAGDYIGVRNAGGDIAVFANDHTIRFLASSFVQRAKDILPIPDNNSYGVVACASNFYSIVNNASNFTIRQYDNSGTYTSSTWTISGQYERNSGAVINDQYFYWSNTDTILGWNLNTNSALPNLVTLTGFRVTTMRATADGKLAVIWINDIDNLPSTLIVYNTDGSIWASATYTGLELVSISLTIDQVANKIWVGRRDQGPYAFLLLLSYGSGGGFTVEKIIQTPSISTNFPPSAEFGFMPLVAGSGDNGGLFKLIADKTHDEVWLGSGSTATTGSYAEIKKPDPFAITALFGDEP